MENLTRVLMLVLLTVSSVLGYQESSLMFTTFGALVAATYGLTELYKTIKNLPKFLIQVGSWALGILLALSGWQLDLGFLAELLWYESALYGFGASLVANSVFDSETVQFLITFISSLFKKKEVEEVQEIEE
jgi:hypothetical protein